MGNFCTQDVTSRNPSTLDPRPSLSLLKQASYSMTQILEERKSTCRRCKKGSSHQDDNFVAGYTFWNWIPRQRDLVESRCLASTLSTMMGVMLVQSLQTGVSLETGQGCIFDRSRTFDAKQPFSSISDQSTSQVRTFEVRWYYEWGHS